MQIFMGEVQPKGYIDLPWIRAVPDRALLREWRAPSSGANPGALK